MDVDDATFFDDETGEVWTVAEMRERAEGGQSMAEDMLPKPSIGKTVHYNMTGRCIAAIVAAVSPEEMVDLHTFPAGGHSIPVNNVPKDIRPGGWHWPERD